MTGTAFSSVSSRSSYWQVSRAPRYSLLFALPLLVFYQVLAVLLAHGERSIRNGADVILQSLFTAVAGAWGPPLFMVCLIGAGLWLVMRHARPRVAAPERRVCGDAGRVHRARADLRLGGGERDFRRARHAADARAPRRAGTRDGLVDAAHGLPGGRDLRGAAVPRAARRRARRGRSGPARLAPPHRR